MENQSNIEVSVIIATYNMPEWLEKVLWGYENQTYKDFEVIIADDGSGDETKKVIDKFIANDKLSIQHVWHEDEGYRRQTILNVAITKARYDYILFTDGDCVPKANFLQTHIAHATNGRFMSGGYCKLPMELSQQISQEDIISQRCFDPVWLKERGLSGSSQLRKLKATETTGKVLDTITPAKATFNNCNTSVWKEDLLQVNGYDERMQYGGPDRELGQRLENCGIKGKQIRHRAICIHLDHGRGYKTKESVDKNLRIRKESKRKKVIKTPYGIDKFEPDNK